MGHIFFSPVTCTSRANLVFTQLSPVSVLPSLQGKGIGTELIEAGLERCRREDCSAVFLVGNPAYYSRFGFRLAAELGLHCGGEHDPYLQYLELKAGSLGTTGGSVEFEPAFSQH